MIATRLIAPQRRGIILVLVVALLALFAVVALAFVLYAESSATAAREYRETHDLSNTVLQQQEPPDTLFNWGMGRLIYDVADDSTGVYSAIRGHSLARDMYGWNYGLLNGQAGMGLDLASRGFVFNPGEQSNTTPFSGTGVLAGTFTVTGATPQTIESEKFVNYTYFNYEAAFAAAPYNRSDNIVRDPERYPQSASETATTIDFRTSPTAPLLQPYLGGANPNYTYPDRNHMFLAAVQPSTGTVLMPSFHRTWLFNPPLPPAIPTAQPTPVGLHRNSTFISTADPGNVNWTNADGKYRILRPRPVDQITPKLANDYGVALPLKASLTTTERNDLETRIAKMQADGRLFPYPSDATGDVKNLIGAPGGNDSIWMQLDYPVRTNSNGKKYQPMFAYLIVDLDGRVNVNVHGNIAGVGNNHVSHMGVGRHEISLAQVFNLNTTEYKNLFAGVNPVPGRYGIGQAFPSAPLYTVSPTLRASQPTLTTLPTLPDEAQAPFYSPYDFDGRNENATSLLTTPLTYPYIPLGGNLTTPSYITSFPLYNQGPTNTGYGDGYINNGVPATIPASERYRHPLLYNPLRLVKGNTRFSDGDLARFLSRYNDNVDYATTDLALLMPNHFARAAYRHSFTTRSFDFDRPGATPAIWNVTESPLQLMLPANGGNPSSTPGVPDGGLPLAPNNSSSTAPNSPKPPKFPEFTQLGIDLTAANAPRTADFIRTARNTTTNPLATYKNSDWRSLAAQLGGVDINRALTPYATAASPVGNYAQAVTDRQNLAYDIFVRLVAVTGATPVDVSASAIQTQNFNSDTSGEFATLKWLAQLSVNVVDYVDSDDYMTPFNFVYSYYDKQGIPRPVAPTTPQTIIDQINKAYVYGVEMPKVIINEAYAEVRNSSSNSQQINGNTYLVNFWCELLNPLRNDPNKANPAIDRSVVNLQNGNQASYRVLVVEQSSTSNFDPKTLRNWNNSRGMPLDASGNINTAAIKARILQWGDGSASDPILPLLPLNDKFQDNTAMGALKNDGFYVVGPDQDDFEGGSGSFTPTKKIKDKSVASTPDQAEVGMQQQFHCDVQAEARPTFGMPPPPSSFGPGPQPNTSLNNYTFLLQRLVCPDQQWSQTENPYVTVDYFENVPAQDAIKYQMPVITSPASSPQPNTHNAHKDIGQRLSRGRQEPYVALLSLIKDGNPKTTPSGQPKSTFFQHNSHQDTPSATAPWVRPAAGSRWDTELFVPFHWLIHLDRKLVNPMEILHVSAVKPAELTHQFAATTQVPGPTGQPIQATYLYAHTAPWFDEAWKGVPVDPTSGVPTYSTRLYRALDFLRIGDRSLEAASGGRVPGKININTVWDLTTFKAICDAQDRVTQVSNDFARREQISTNPTTNNDNVPGFTFNNNPVSPLQIQQLWSDLVAGRTPQGIPGPDDRPFWGSAGPLAPNGDPQFQQPSLGATVEPNGRTRSLVRDAVTIATPGSVKVPRTPFDPYTYSPSIEGQLQFNGTGHDTDALPPALRNELLEKISGHITTRSNVFAVYLTVGFFEVIDDTVSPPRLGAELGIQNGTQVRHRFFSIVDRTNIALDFDPLYSAKLASSSLTAAQKQAILNNEQQSRFQQAARWPLYFAADTSVPAVQSAPGGSPSYIDVVVSCPMANSGKSQGTTVQAGDFLSGQYDGGIWRIQPGDTLYCGQGPSFQGQSMPDNPTPERATVQRVIYNDADHSQNKILLRFNYPTRGLPYGFLISNVVPGNPGPQPKFDYRDPRYAAVIRYAGKAE